MLSDIYQNIYTADQTLASGIQPLLATEEPNPTRGHVIVNESLDKTRPIDLFHRVVIPPEKQRSYQLAQSLFDNYDLAAHLPDQITPQESEEIHTLLEYVIDRAPMRIAREYIEQTNGRQYSDAAWYATVKETWFQPFQVGSSPTRSGFEHVFLGEDKQGKIGGLHWWYFYYTHMNDMTYRGAVYKNTSTKSGVTTPEIATLAFSWNVDGKHIFKPIGGFFVGPSVEGLMAMGMVRANADAAAPNVAVIEGVEVELKLFTSPNGRSINTFYPVFRRLITGAAPTALRTEVIPSTVPPVHPPSPAEREMVSSYKVLIISAVVNPEGADRGREKVTLMNVSDKEEVNLEGWRLVGPNKSFMVFGDVVLEGGSARTFVIPVRSRLHLSNKGGNLSLVDSSEKVIHSTEYSNEVARVQGGVLMWNGETKLILASSRRQ